LRVKMMVPEVLSDYFLTDPDFVSSDYAFDQSSNLCQNVLDSGNENQVSKLAFEENVDEKQTDDVDCLNSKNRLIFGNPISLSGLKQKIEKFKDGNYLPVITDGVLEFMVSESQIKTEENDKNETAKSLSSSETNGNYLPVITDGVLEFMVSECQLKTEENDKNEFAEALSSTETIVENYNEQVQHSSNFSSSDVTGTCDFVTKSVTESSDTTCLLSTSESAETAVSFGVFDSEISTNTAILPESEPSAKDDLVPSEVDEEYSLEESSTQGSETSTETSLEIIDDADLLAELDSLLVEANNYLN
uniref:Uncharacterized protein n=1 Tax=Panagrolaimus sp. JU765 TaxID=591449 RepID=A0AC34RQP0_9BILA